MKLIFLMCAQSAVIDQATNNLSIHNILEQVGAPVFPIAVPMSVVGYLTRKKTEKENQTLRLSLKLDRAQLADEPLSVNFQGKLATRIIARIQPLVVERPGQLLVELKARGQSLGAWQVRIYKAGEEILLRNAPAGARDELRPVAEKKTAKAPRIVERSKKKTAKTKK